MDEIVAVGEVTDEVLLQCGKPDALPSAWWTPSLLELSEQLYEVLLAATEELLVDVGARDPDTGALTGPLGEVAAVAEAARLVVLIETEVRTDRGGVCGRRSIVVAQDRALLDRPDPEEGTHDLLLATPSAAVELLADLLAPQAPPSPPVRALAGRRTPGEVMRTLPGAERTATTRITRTVVARDGVTGGVHMVTIVDHDAGAVACWALPGGDVQVQVLDADAVVAAALLLLGADTVEVAA